MKPGEPSLTARLCAASRGAHLRRDGAPKILNDIYADELSGFSAHELEAEDDDQLRDFQSSAFRVNMVVRSRFVEDALANLASRSRLQYVILGAGLDTFAHRKPEQLSQVDVYEVDHPSMQKWKLNRLRELGITIDSRLHFVPVDFEAEHFDEELQAANIDRSTPTLFSFLGVSQYISKPALENTATRALNCVDGYCEFIVNIIPPIETLPQRSATVMRSVTAKAASVGEPYLSFWKPDEIREFLVRAGFDDVFHFGPDKLRNQYCAGRDDGLAVGSVLNLVRAVQRSQ